MNCDLDPNFVVGKGTILVVSNLSFEDKYMEVNPFSMTHDFPPTPQYIVIPQRKPYLAN